MRIGVMLVASDLFGQPYGLRECQEKLRGMNFKAVAYRLSLARQANDLLFDGENVQGQAGLDDCEKILPVLLGRRMTQMALEQAASLIPAADFHLFSDQALAATLELALQCCQRIDGRDLSKESDLDELGKIVFSLQGASFSPRWMRMIKRNPDWDKASGADLSEVIRNNLAHNRLGSPANAVSRLYSFFRTPSIQASFLERTREPFETWFQRRLAMTPEEYMRAAFLVGVAASRYQHNTTSLDDMTLNVDAVLLQIPESDRPNVQRLLRLASLDAAAFTGATAANLADFLYQAQGLRLRPIIATPEFYLPTSATAVLDKFLIGIPHLLDEVARAADPNADPTFVRLKFGHIVERYVGHLIETWLAGRTDAKVLVGHRVGPNDTDWDVIIVMGTVAYMFEVKAKVFLLGMRKEGSFAFLDMMLSEPINKTRLQAESLLAHAKDESAHPELKSIRRVVPVLVVFDRVPLRAPYVDHYEKHLESKLGKKIFSEPGDSIAPLQIFELEGLEKWEQFIDLSPSSTELFKYLDDRANDPLTRYQLRFPPADDERDWRTPDGPVQKSLSDSKAFFELLRSQVRLEP
jgi:hypothetical protein